MIPSSVITALNERPFCKGILSGGLTGVNVEIDAECKNLNTNSKYEFRHEILDLLTTLP